MPGRLRSTVKRIAQKVLGHHNVRDFARTRRLWLDKKLYRRPIAVADLRQRLTALGVTRGRTVWVQSSWNEFFNVPMKPSEVIDLLRELIGPEGTLAMPAFPIDHDPEKVFMVDRAPVNTGLLCEVFRRMPDVQRSIHLSSSVCAIGPNADFLLRDHHRTDMTWGKESPFCRLMDVDARMLGLGATFNFMTPLHAVECLLHEEIPFFRQVFNGTIRYRWKRANGETGEHEFLKRGGDIRPQRLRRHFGTELVTDSKLSNLKMMAADAKPFIEHAVALGRKGITMYIEPVPKKELFIPRTGTVS